MMSDGENKNLVRPISKISNAERQAKEELQKWLFDENAKINSLKYTNKDNYHHIEISMVEDNIVKTASYSYGEISKELNVSQIDVSNKAARNDNIARMYNEGYSQVEIARKHGISNARVHGILSELGLKR